MKKRLLYWVIVFAFLAALLPATPVQAQTTETLRPNAAGDYQAWEELVGTSHWAATSDSLNTTYIKTTGPSSKRDVQHLAAPTFPEGDQIDSVTYYITANATGSGGKEKLDIIAKLGASDQVVSSRGVVITRNSWNDYASDAQTTAPDGASWTYQKITDLQAGIQVAALDTDETISVSEIWVVVVHTYTAPLSTAIFIVNKVGDTAVATITFPEGAPSATISAPYNDVDTSSAPQFLDGNASEPVVRLKNTSAGTLTVWLEITAWTNGVVVSHDYELVDPSTVNVNVVNDVLSADGGAVASFSTGVTIGAGAYGALYLEVTLGALTRVSGTSTLTILGES